MSREVVELLRLALPGVSGHTLRDLSLLDARVHSLPDRWIIAVPSYSYTRTFSVPHRVPVCPSIYGLGPANGIDFVPYDDPRLTPCRADDLEAAVRGYFRLPFNHSALRWRLLPGLCPDPTGNFKKSWVVVGQTGIPVGTTVVVGSNANLVTLLAPQICLATHGPYRGYPCLLPKGLTCYHVKKQ